MKCYGLDQFGCAARKPRDCAVLVVAVSLIWICPAAVAADWEVLPVITAGAYANDNYTLSPDTVDPVEVEGAQIKAELALHARTQLTRFSLTPRIESMIFPDEEEWESNDYYVRLDWTHERERFLAGLRADYSDETTVKSELPSDQDGGGLGDPDGGDGGIVAVDNNRRRVQVRPKVSFELTERSSLLVDAGYVDADYDQESATGTSGFEQISGAIGIGFATTPTSTVSARAIASNYERNVDGVTTDSYGVELERLSRLTDVTQWYFRVGVEQVDVPSTVPGEESSSETGFDGGIGADWAFSELTRLFIDATASVEPNASGRIVQRNQLRLRLQREFGPRTSGWIGGRYHTDDTLSEEVAGTFRDRDYAIASLGFEWRFSRDFSLVGQYEARWQEFEDGPSTSSGNAFQLSVLYQWRRID
jgi:hypothetical protein